MIRRAVPQLLIPLALVANLLAADPWLRAFPVTVAAIPLLGAALLSVIVPVASFRLGTRLWLAILIDVAAALLYELFIVLHDPGGFAALIDGLHHGPSQLLTFALPLVSPRSLMVGPALLIWTAGAVAGECLTRRWATVLPYIGVLTSFGLAYAATQRAAAPGNGERVRESLVAGALLAALLLLRTAQAWVRQDDDAESTQPDGVLPLRSFGIGVLTAAIVAVVAALVVQSAAFPHRAHRPQREPSVDASRPLAPVQFVAGLRPSRTKADPAALFQVHLDASAPGYFSIANLDFYDGSGWSFDRTFRPSGGVLPADSDTQLAGAGTVVTQQYRVVSGPLTDAPWIPMLYRAQRVTGAAVDIDTGSGMVVPSARLGSGSGYSVLSRIAPDTFGALSAEQATPDTATPANDVQLPPTLRDTIDKLITGFAAETGTPVAPALPFLKALQSDLLRNYALSGAARGSATGTKAPAPSSSASPSASTASSGAAPSGQAAAERPLADRTTPRRAPKKPAHTAKHTTPAPRPTTPSPSPTSSDAAAELAGGTAFADVVASVLGPQRAGTPEQFATLVALVARELGVPARIATGFRVEHRGSAQLPAGEYTVTTANAWTWVEVPVVGHGWLVLDAAPSQYSDSNRAPDAGASSSPSPTTTPSQAQITQSSGGGHAVAPKAHPSAPSSASSSAALVALGLALGTLLVVLLLVFALRKPVRRRRRRRAADPRAQLLGAWRETLDMLSESGLPELLTLTSAEIAELAGEQFGSAPRERVGTLATTADAAAYSSVALVDPATVEQAWSAQRLLRRDVRRQLSPGARFAAALRYHRSRRVNLLAGPESWVAENAARSTAASGRRSRLGPPRRYRGRRRR